MDDSELTQYDIIHPGRWIVGADRDRAYDTAHFLGLAEQEFLRAVVAYSMFTPLTLDTSTQNLEPVWSRYDTARNTLYAREFVFSLAAVIKILNVMKEHLDPPSTVKALIEEYEESFGHLKHIRDSIAHVEDRGRGLDRRQQEVPSNLLVLSALIENRFCATGADGRHYEVTIEAGTITTAHRSLQSIFDAFDWE